MRVTDSTRWGRAGVNRRRGRTPQFHEFAEKVKDAGVHFIIEPHLRFKGQPGEQHTMFFQVSTVSGRNEVMPC